MDTMNVYPPSGYCMDAEFRGRLFDRGVLYFLRGLAAALLMPIEMLDCLRRGHRVSRHTWLSWLFSVALYASSFEIWVLARRALMDGHDRTGTILGYSLGVLVVAIVGGRLQTRDNLRRTDLHAHAYFGAHHRHHDGRCHRRFAPDRVIESRGEALASQKQITIPVTCCGDCRQCESDICVKTGLPRQRRAK